MRQILSRPGFCCLPEVKLALSGGHPLAGESAGLETGGHAAEDASKPQVKVSSSRRGVRVPIFTGETGNHARHWNPNPLWDVRVLGHLVVTSAARLVRNRTKVGDTRRPPNPYTEPLPCPEQHRHELSAKFWGTRGPRFKSVHSDQQKSPQPRAFFISADASAWPKIAF